MAKQDIAKVNESLETANCLSDCSLASICLKKGSSGSSEEECISRPLFSENKITELALAIMIILFERTTVESIVDLSYKGLLRNENGIYKSLEGDVL